MPQGLPPQAQARLVLALLCPAVHHAKERRGASAAGYRSRPRWGALAVFSIFRLRVTPRPVPLVRSRKRVQNYIIHFYPPNFFTTFFKKNFLAPHFQLFTSEDFLMTGGGTIGTFLPQATVRVCQHHTTCFAESLRQVSYFHYI